MVNRVFTEKNPEIAELSRHFVCMKFCETDDRDEYYRAAGYFLPQWYWQPILGITYPDGREINPKWRRTHEILSVPELAGILRAALEAAGEGLDAASAEKARLDCDAAWESAAAGDLAAAGAGLAGILETVRRGRIRLDAENRLRAVEFLKFLGPFAEAVDALPLDDPGAEDLRNAVSFFRLLEFWEGFATLDSARRGGAEAAKLLSDLQEKAGEAAPAFARLHRVSVGTFRFGPEICHDLRVELEVFGLPLPEASLQMYALLKDGRCFARWESFKDLTPSPSRRLSFFLLREDCPDPSNLADVRVELRAGGRLIGEGHLAPGLAGEKWWTRDSFHTLGGAACGRSTFASPGLLENDDWGTVFGRDVKNLDGPASKDLVLSEMIQAFKVLDWNRTQPAAQAALFRIVALGSKSLPWAAPLAARDGAITTIQMIPVLARVPRAEAAERLIHVLGADDVTLWGSTLSGLACFEGEDFVPTGGLREYLSSEEENLRGRAARALACVGGREDVLPLMKMWREAAPGSRPAREAAAAFASILGRDFGFDPGKPLAEQPDQVRAFSDWWNENGGKPRALWLAAALEECGAADRGALTKALEAGQTGAVAPLLTKAFASERETPRRLAVLVAMLLGLDCLRVPVFAEFKDLPERSRTFPLYRTYLRRFCDEDVLLGFIALLGNRSSSSRALDFLLTVTGEWDLCPADETDGREKALRFAEWFDDNRASLKWDASERRFSLK